MRKLRSITMMCAACLIVTGVTAAMSAGAEAVQDEPSYVEGTSGDYSYWKYEDYVWISGYNRQSEATKIEIPSEIEGLPVTGIGVYAFGGCKSLTQIDVPESVTYISWAAFSECTSLTRVELPSDAVVETDCLFEACVSLKEVVIPKTVTQFNELMFSGCFSLTDVYYTGTEEEWNEIKIYDLNSSNGSLQDATIHFNYVREGAFKTGDPDGDGEITAIDAQLVLQAAAEVMAGNDSGLTPAQFAAVDIDGDGEITVVDAQLILNYYANVTLGGLDVTWEDIISGKF